MKKFVFALIAAFTFVFSAATFQNGDLTQNSALAKPAVTWKWSGWSFKNNKLYIKIRYTNNTTDRVVTRIYDRRLTLYTPAIKNYVAPWEKVSENRNYHFKRVIKLNLGPGESYTCKMEFTNKTLCGYIAKYYKGIRDGVYKTSQYLRIPKHTFKYKTTGI